MKNTSSAVRVQFAIIAVNVLIGIGLTGFGQVHWWLFVPPVALLFAAITGFCPGFALLNKCGLK